MEIALDESDEIDTKILNVLLRISKRWNEISQVTLVVFIFYPDEYLMIIVNNQCIARPIQPKLMECGADLRGKRKITSRRIFVSNDYPYFIDDVGLSDAS